MGWKGGGWSSPISTAVTVVMIAILATGTLLRLYNLDGNSLWNDELESWSRSHCTSLEQVMQKSIRLPGNTPIHQIILYYVQKYLGDTEYLLRFPSAVSGILCIFAVFLLGRSLYSNREGLIASALMAALWCPIYYSQEARPYTMLSLFSIVTIHLWLKIGEAFRYEESQNKNIIILYILAAVFCSYLHHYGLLLIVFQAGYLVIAFGKKPKALARILLLYLPVSIALLPWISVILHHWERGNNWRPTPEWRTFFSYLKFLFNQSNILLALVGVICGASLIKAIVRSLRGCQNIRAALWSPEVILICWLIIPFAVAFVIGKLSMSVFAHRYMLVSLPAAYLLFARAIASFFPHRKNLLLSVFSVGLVLLFLVQLVFVRQYYNLPQKPQYREAAGYVVAKDSMYPDNLVIGRARHIDYYLRQIHPDNLLIVKDSFAKDIPHVRYSLESRKPSFVWFMHHGERFDDEFLTYLDGKLHMIEKRTFHEVGVVLYRNDPD